MLLSNAFIQQVHTYVGRIRSALHAWRTQKHSLVRTTWRVCTPILVSHVTVTTKMFMMHRIKENRHKAFQ